MTTYTKNILSSSVNGRAILISASATAGTLVHTATSGSINLDEIWLWAVNSDTASNKLTVEFGGTTSPNDTIEVTIPGESGLVLVSPGLLLQNGLAVRAFSATGSIILIHGFVNRITA